MCVLFIIAFLSCDIAFLLLIICLFDWIREIFACKCEYFCCCSTEESFLLVKVFGETYFFRLNRVEQFDYTRVIAVINIDLAEFRIRNSI